MKNKLDELEARLQALVETQMMEILPGFKLEDRVIHRLANAIKQNITQEKGKDSFAPDVFTLILPPQTDANWQEPRILDSLKDIIVKVGEETGLKFASKPTITITSDEALSSGEIHVIASHKLEPITDTQGTPPNSGIESDENENIPDNAFLIVEGVKVHALTESVVNIGRRDRKSTRLNSSHIQKSRMPSSA